MHVSARTFVDKILNPLMRNEVRQPSGDPLTAEERRIVHQAFQHVNEPQPILNALATEYPDSYAEWLRVLYTGE
jgi:hypothetical protein